MLTWSVPLGLICALLGLAFLQFRWSVEVSQATTTRIHADLQNSMMNFRQDFSRDLAGLCLELQVVSGMSSTDAKNLASRLQHWQRTNPNPDLPHQIYLWQASGKQESRLFRLQLPDERFEPAEWPEELEGIRQALIISQTPSATSSAATRPASQATPPRVNLDSLEIGGIDESVPVLAIPAAPHSSSNWLLITLDFAALQKQEFPQLATRYFGDLRSSDYAVGVIAGPMTDRKVVYSSDSSVLKDNATSADASINLFGPPVSPGTTPQIPVETSLASESSATRAQGFPLSDPAGIFGPVRFDPIPSSREQRDWRVVARHRKGSVEAAVADLRRRNLALSFGVLLVLAGSVFTIFFYTQRARRLAGLQMEFVLAYRMSCGRQYPLFFRSPTISPLELSRSKRKLLITARSSGTRRGSSASLWNRFYDSPR